MCGNINTVTDTLCFQKKGIKNSEFLTEHVNKVCRCCNKCKMVKLVQRKWLYINRVRRSGSLVLWRLKASSPPSAPLLPLSPLPLGHYSILLPWGTINSKLSVVFQGRAAVSCFLLRVIFTDLTDATTREQVVYVSREHQQFNLSEQYVDLLWCKHSEKEEFYRKLPPHRFLFMFSTILLLPLSCQQNI